MTEDPRDRVRRLAAQAVGRLGRMDARLAELLARIAEAHCDARACTDVARRLLRGQALDDVQARVLARMAIRGRPSHAVVQLAQALLRAHAQIEGGQPSPAGSIGRADARR